MDFSTDIFKLSRNKNVSIQLIGAIMPTQKDVFFRAKQEEIFRQYESARIFLSETETDDWNHWFEKTEPENQEVFELFFMERMFECALMYYNIVVDLSWTLCYVSAEYALYEENKKVDMDITMNIEEAYKTIRKAENSVTGPNSQDNPFEYLKCMCPEYEDSIDLIIDFWKKFSNTKTRSLYNYIKHKGKPLYEESEKFGGGKFVSLVVDDEIYPSDIRDVQKVINLKDSINELKEFDDTMLFPYIKKLFELLELAVNPSPFVL